MPAWCFLAFSDVETGVGLKGPFQLCPLHCAQKCSKLSPMRTSPVPSAYLYIALSAMKESASGMRKDAGKVAESLILSSLTALRDG